MLSRNFIESSFTQNGTGSIIMSRLKAALAFEQPFSFESDIQTVHQFTVKQTNPVDAVIGSNNGNENLASITAGELIWTTIVLDCCLESGKTMAIVLI